MAKNHHLPVERMMNPLTSFRNEISDFFDRFNRDLSFDNDRSFMPKVEVKDKGKSYCISAELPGMNENDISLSISDDTLIIEGEKKSESNKEDEGFYRSEFSYGSFYRAIPLAKDVNPDTVSADYVDGVLKINIDKVAQSESKSKRIAINKGAGKNQAASEKKH